MILCRLYRLIQKLCVVYLLFNFNPEVKGNIDPMYKTVQRGSRKQDGVARVSICKIFGHAPKIGSRPLIKHLWKNC